MLKHENKYKFNLDFQELIIQYMVANPKGFRVLDLVQDFYFATIPHQVVVYAVKKYYKKYKKVPGEVYLREFLRTVYSRGEFSDMLPEDKDQVDILIGNIYKPMLDPGEEIVKKVVDFARYIEFKSELENVDINDFDSYEKAIQGLKEANNLGLEVEKNYGVFVVSGIKDRAYKRQDMQQANPTPFKQINALLNSGGLQRGSVICYLGKEKRFKTGVLINTAVGYLKLKKKVFYVDLENGEMAITVRVEQSMSKQLQETIISEQWEEHLLKMMRKYKRLGSELVIKRFPALSTSMADVSKWLDVLEMELGMKFDVGIVDYGMLLDSISHKQDEFGRISDAFLDMKNLANDRDLEAIYTAAHITREGDKRTKSKYAATDIAKCIDIPRHVDALLGLQENDEEKEAGVLRVEVLEQRNGMREGSALFWVDIPKQILKEFSKSEITSYKEQLGEYERPTNKRERKSDLD